MDLNQIFFVLFLLWSLPLGFLRAQYRKMVYGTDSWFIVVKPVFWRELKVLFGFEEAFSARLVIRYRVYLIVYFLLLAGFLYA